MNESSKYRQGIWDHPDVVPLVNILKTVLIIYQQADLSSVGRAEDCSVSQISLGRWFESGRSEYVFIILN
jgi:hypothetical protein